MKTHKRASREELGRGSERPGEREGAERERSKRLYCWTLPERGGGGRGGERENSKTLFYKSCSLGLVKNLTTSAC